MVHQHYMGCAKQKSAFKHVQNAQIQIILHMHKVPSGPMLSSHTFCNKYPMILLVDSEGPDQTAPVCRLISAFAARICPKTCFCIARPICNFRQLNCVQLYLKSTQSCCFLMKIFFFCMKMQFCINLDLVTSLLGMHALGVCGQETLRLPSCSESLQLTYFQN